MAFLKLYFGFHPVAFLNKNELPTKDLLSSIVDVLGHLVYLILAVNL
jgi:hypothetical protein